jgi:hypothetical protein
MARDTSALSNSNRLQTAPKMDNGSTNIARPAIMRLPGSVPSPLSPFFHQLQAGRQRSAGGGFGRFHILPGGSHVASTSDYAVMLQAGAQRIGEVACMSAPLAASPSGSNWVRDVTGCPWPRRWRLVIEPALGSCH